MKRWVWLWFAACHAPAVTPSAPPAPEVVTPAPAPREEKAPLAEQESLEAWLTRNAPSDARVHRDDTGILHVKLPRKAGDNVWKIARQTLSLTEYYQASTLALALQRAKPAPEWDIPRLVKTPFPDDPERERITPPADGVRAVFVTGSYAAGHWIELIDKVKAHGLNGVVLDAKDYEGQINYPSQVKIALETKATTSLIPDLARAIRMAHLRGLYVILRIPAFHDPWTSKRAPRLSVQGDWGKPFPMGWLDPQNEEAHEYIADLAEEGIRAGADENQLDYVRYPVHHVTERALFAPPKDGARMRVIRDFVRKVHARTQAHGVPLSLDIFGVTATGTYQKDLEMLGQDIGVLAPEAEILSPMVYPSHYTPGYMGFAQPGDHPEIIGIATKAAVARLPPGSKTVIRQWLQAFPDRSPHFGAEYVKTEARLAEAHGGVGWLLWSPACNYWAAWQAWPAR